MLASSAARPRRRRQRWETPTMTDVQDLARELERTEIVSTSNGPVRGYRDGPLHVFKGLRYGAPPLGALRFTPPQPPKPWTEVAEALTLGAPAIQVGVPPGETTGGSSAGDPPAPGQPGTDEDCLYLNVWTQGLTGRRPVMVWLHGGGFAAGSGGAAMYDGGALARRRGDGDRQPSPQCLRLPEPRRARRPPAVRPGRHARHRPGARVGAGQHR